MTRTHRPQAEPGDPGGEFTNPVTDTAPATRDPDAAPDPYAHVGMDADLGTAAGHGPGLGMGTEASAGPGTDTGFGPGAGPGVPAERGRQALMATGVLVGTLMLAMAAVLIGGSSTMRTLDAADWPGEGNGMPKASALVKPTPTRHFSTAPGRSALPTASGTVAAANTPATSSTPSGPGGPAAGRPASEPPADSRTPAAARKSPGHSFAAETSAVSPMPTSKHGQTVAPAPGSAATPTTKRTTHRPTASGAPSSIEPSGEIGANAEARHTPSGRTKTSASKTRRPQT